MVRKPTPPTKLKCAHCGKPAQGRTDKRYCGPKCRVKAMRARNRK